MNKRPLYYNAGLSCDAMMLRAHCRMLTHRSQQIAHVLILMISLTACDNIPGVARSHLDFERASNCAGVDRCIAELLETARSRQQIGSGTMHRLAAQGDPAARMLIPLLRDPDPWVQESAGLALAQFRTLRPSYLGPLVSAWRNGKTALGGGEKGNGWLPRGIAAIGTNDALRLLWADFLRDPSQSSNSQVFSALAMFDDRLEPLVTPVFGTCEKQPGRACTSVLELMEEMKPRIPAWGFRGLERLSQATRNEDAQRTAEIILVEVRHPAGLQSYQRRLEARAVEVATYDDTNYPLNLWLVNGVGAYGRTRRSERRQRSPLVQSVIEPPFRR